jgi:hypothetical protein
MLGELGVEPTGDPEACELLGLLLPCAFKLESCFRRVLAGPGKVGWG